MSDNFARRALFRILKEALEHLTVRIAWEQAVAIN
jgi:hypothetical protein